MGLYYNLSIEEKEFAKKKSFFCLIIYDIVSNKRRLQLSKLLEGFGVRVQRSCFEIDLERTSYQILIRELEYFYDPSELDNIIIYVGNREETLRLNTDDKEIKVQDCLFFWNENDYNLWYNKDSFQIGYILCLFLNPTTKYGV